MLADTKMTDSELSVLIQKIGAQLTLHKWLLATAESCTGGGIAVALTDVADSSQWFAGGLVTYSNAWKQQLLGVKDETLAQFGAVSSETVQEMLMGLARRQQVQVGLAVSGIAGPSGAVPGKPIGTVFLGVLCAGQTTVQRYNFSGERWQVRRQSVEAALLLLLQALNNFSIAALDVSNCG